MKIKDVEKRLEEAAENMQLRSFADRWDAIKGEVMDEKNSTKRKMRPVKKWLPAVMTACTVAISAAIIIPIALENQRDKSLYVPNGGENTLGVETSNGDMITSGDNTEQETSEDNYYGSQTDDMKMDWVTFDELKQRMSALNITVAEFENMTVDTCGVYASGENYQESVGYYITYMDDLETSNYVLEVEARTLKTLKYEKENFEYLEEKTYSVNGMPIKYWLTFAEEGVVYEYVIKAEHNGMYYVLSYLCIDEDIKPFLDDFFGKIQQ